MAKSIPNDELRRCLKEIIDEATASKMNAKTRKHLITDLAETHPHEIRCPEANEANEYNCFEYAFELVDSQKYRRIAQTDADVGREIFFAGTEFARFLIEGGAREEITEAELRPGDVVIYLDDNGAPKHAGKIAPCERRVKSKWGGGLFLEHGLSEVPESYGNTVKFYRRIPAAQAEQEFLEFVKSRDSGEEFIDDYDLRYLF